MNSIKFIGIICLIIANYTNQQVNNRCAVSLNRLPIEAKDCLGDTSVPGVTCCYVKAYDKNNQSASFCEPRLTVDILADPTPVFKTVSSNYGLTYDSYSCTSNFITLSLYILFMLLAFLI